MGERIAVVLLTLTFAVPAFIAARYFQQQAKVEQQKYGDNISGGFAVIFFFAGVGIFVIGVIAQLL